MDSTKRCRNCDVEFTPLHYAQVNCSKSCTVAAKNRRWRLAHPEAAEAATARWRRRNTEKMTETRRAYQAKYKDKLTYYNFAYGLKRNYGISAEDYMAMYERQGGVCALCGFGDKLCVDHDHESGRVRGLLCYLCNTALGRLVGDDTAKLEVIRAYMDNTP